MVATARFLLVERKKQTSGMQNTNMKTQKEDKKSNQLILQQQNPKDTQMPCHALPFLPMDHHCPNQ